ncbi:MAG: radical SAM family heme chaperone HemW, partial [Verrucomicrobiia bacterium]
MREEVIRHVYVHVPFCTHICPYCAFVKTKNALPEMKVFLRALRREVEAVRRRLEVVPTTVYWGGGTPTALSVGQWEEIMAWWPWGGEGIEFTVEANPATVSARKAELLVRAGVNRLSLGVQSFDPKMLRLLGRTHDREQVKETVEVVREAGLRNVNLDLMFALPGQSEALWQQTLEEAVRLGPQHVSCYNLNYEEDTEFLQRLHRGEFVVDAERERRFFLGMQEMLSGAGFLRDEVSNYARPGFSCRHNWAYWEGADYVGVGPGACSTVGGERWRNVGKVGEWAEQVEQCGRGVAEVERLSERTRGKERVMLGLRTRAGVKIERGEMAMQAAKLAEEGLAEIQGERLVLTSKGLLVADSIAELFYD